MKHKIYCIVGRTGSGKDHIVKEAIEILNTKFNEKVKKVVSYTDREIRDGEVDGEEHYFISKEEFDKIESTEELAAYTKIQKNDGSGYRYTATVSEVEKSTFYIINPNGIVDFRTRNGDRFDLIVIYIDTSDENRYERAKERSDFKTKFADRNEAESPEFERFASNMEYDYRIDNNNSLESSVSKLLRIYDYYSSLDDYVPHVIIEQNKKILDTKILITEADTKTVVF